MTDKAYNHELRELYSDGYVSIEIKTFAQMAAQIGTNAAFVTGAETGSENMELSLKEYVSLYFEKRHESEELSVSAIEGSGIIYGA